MTAILLVDDVPAMLDQYAYDLQRLGQYELLSALSGEEALETLHRENVDCVVLDLEMVGLGGLGVLRAMSEQQLEVPVIVYTGTGSYERCVQAIRLGAYTFIDKTEPVERLAREIENAMERRRLLAEVSSLRKYMSDDTALFGQSPAMQKLKDTIARIAPIPSPVLIMGESGSGKELVARDVHRLSGNAREPFVAVNCAALPEQLVESELFGHERGAFTGAATLRRGAFESAGKGTIFLDEIGELPLAAQAKLLRVLEDRTVTRIGATRAVPVPARVVAATNRNLADEVRAGRFRQDLYFRLNVHTLSVPPLRERLSDIPELVDRLLTSTCEKFRMRRKRLGDAALRALMSYDWQQNNVRELRNVVERMVIAADGEELAAEHIPEEIRQRGAADPELVSAHTLIELKAEAERRIVVMALERNDWHITRTARELGLADHASLLKIMRRHRIARD
jgi:two-component system nitrogen regulation response regulator NtrX